MLVEEDRMKVYGSIEAGGTKIVCLIAKSSTKILDQWVIQTEMPEMTLNATVAYFKGMLLQHPEWQLQSIGIASFGPIDLTLTSKTYGFIQQTPKPGWAGTDLVGFIQREMGVPVYLDTDVGGAALAEYTLGAGKEKNSLIYLTIGTGIGGAYIHYGKNIYGIHHAEYGHMKVPRIPDDAYRGGCPFHDDCLEGMASGPAMLKRWGIPADQLPMDHPGWDYEAAYLGQAVINLIYTLSPEIIVLGGGVMNHAGLIDKVQDFVHANMNAYCQPAAYRTEIRSTIVLPQCGNIAGAIGGLILAENGLKAKK